MAAYCLVSWALFLSIFSFFSWEGGWGQCLLAELVFPILWQVLASAKDVSGAEESPASHGKKRYVFLHAQDSGVS
jgi:hypothetical protein